MKTFYINLRLVALLLVSTLPSFINHLNSQVIISQIYAGGGSTGCIYNASYVQLFNLSFTPANLNGWSLQWGTGNGNGGFTVIPLPNVTLQPFQAFLITGHVFSKGSAIPSGSLASSNFQLNTAGGKLALVNNLTPLQGSTCNTNVVDFFGYGQANCFRTTAFSALTNTAAAYRISLTNLINAAAYMPLSPVPWSNSFMALPIKLSNFSGNTNKAINDLTWTADIISLANFTIERSENSLDFYRIYSQHESTNGTHTYYYEDGSPVAQIEYYRLKMEDEHGNNTYSTVVELKNTSIANKDVVVYPTLATSVLNVSLRGFEGNSITYTLYSASGNLLQTAHIRPGSANFEFELSLSSVANGQYLLQLNDENGFSKTLKFFKM